MVDFCKADRTMVPAVDGLYYIRVLWYRIVLYHSLVCMSHSRADHRWRHTPTSVQKHSVNLLTLYQ